MSAKRYSEEQIIHAQKQAGDFPCGCAAGSRLICSECDSFRLLPVPASGVNQWGRPYGFITHRRRKQFVDSGAVSLTLTQTGVPVPVSITFVEFQPVPSMFVAIPFQVASFVAVSDSSMISVTSSALVLRLKFRMKVRSWRRCCRRQNPASR